ncbi:MAG: histidine phosphatase family protein [Balneolaceae bacterium]
MKSTNIYLARHGETEYNRLNQIQGRGIDASLNKTGLRQAQAIAEYLKGTKIDKIFSSSLKRSRETARIVAGAHNLDLVSHSDLDEMNFGVLEGRTLSEIKMQLQDLHEHWKSGNIDYALERGESPRAVLERASGRIKSILEEHPKANLLFVLHGRLIRILLAHWLQFGLSSMDRVKHSNGALYHIRWDGKNFEPVYLHCTEHLELEINSQNL